MSVRQWAAELARAFWAEAGAVESFPRSLRRAVARALPASIVLLPRLRWTASAPGCARTASLALATKAIAHCGLAWRLAAGTG